MGRAKTDAVFSCQSQYGHWLTKIRPILNYAHAKLDLTGCGFTSHMYSLKNHGEFFLDETCIPIAKQCYI